MSLRSPSVLPDHTNGLWVGGLKISYQKFKITEPYSIQPDLPNCLFVCLFKTVKNDRFFQTQKCILHFLLSKIHSWTEIHSDIRVTWCPVASKILHDPHFPDPSLPHHHPSHLSEFISHHFLSCLPSLAHQPPCCLNMPSSPFFRSLTLPLSLSEYFLHLHMHALFLLWTLWSNGILEEACSGHPVQKSNTSHLLPCLPLPICLCTQLYFHHNPYCHLKYYTLIPFCFSKPDISFIRLGVWPVSCIALSPNPRTEPGTL